MMNVDRFAWRYLKDIGNSLRIGQTSLLRLSPRSHANMMKKKKKRHGRLESGEFYGANGVEATLSALLSCLVTALASFIQSLIQIFFKGGVCCHLS